MASRSLRRAIRAATASLTLLAAACSPSGSPGPTGSPALQPPVRVAFLQDLSRPDAEDRLLPPLQGAELAFATAALDEEEPVAVELVPFDLAEDPDAPRAVADDGAFAAAIVAPDVDGLPGILETLGTAGVPVVGLTGLDPGVEPAGVWRRLVAPIDAQAEVLAGLADGASSSGASVCVLHEEPPPDGLARLLVRALSSPVVAPADGCVAVVWAGSASAASAALALAPDTPTLGGERLLDPAFLDEAGSSAQGLLVTCSCADLSTSTDLAARRFIQDYQSDYGLAPGPFAVEAADAARLIVRAIREGGRTREDVRSWLDGVTGFEGLGGAYAFDAVGELLEPRASVRVYRAEGGRWVLA